MIQCLLICLVSDNLLLNLFFVWTANWSSTPSAKFKKRASSADDSDICEVEWDSPKPLSGKMMIGGLIYKISYDNVDVTIDLRRTSDLENILRRT